MRIINTVILIAVGLAWPSYSGATPVTFEFAGTLTQVSTDPASPFSDVGFGTPFFGEYIVESTTTDAIAASGSGSYTSPAGPPYGLSVTMGSNKAATSDFLNVGVIDGPVDFYTVTACSGDASCPNLVIELTFMDLAGLLLGNDALPLDTFPLGSAFGTLGLRANVDGNDIELQGAIYALSCTSGCIAGQGPDPNPAPVPEPATMVLCTTGLVGGLMTRMKQRIARMTETLPR